MNFINKVLTRNFFKSSSRMSYTNLLFNLPMNLVRLFRQLENTKKKICKAEWSTVFNNVCLQENLLPSYTRMIINIKSA